MNLYKASVIVGHVTHCSLSHVQGDMVRSHSMWLWMPMNGFETDDFIFMHRAYNWGSNETLAMHLSRCGLKIVGSSTHPLNTIPDLVQS